MLLFVLLGAVGLSFWLRPVSVFRVFNEAQMYLIGARNHTATVDGFRIHYYTLGPENGRPVVLRDGSTVLIRQVKGADAPLLADGFTRLSERSRWLRFLGRKRTLTEADLRFFTDVDHRDHEALGALDHVRGGGVVHRGSGIAEYENDLDGTISRAD